MSREQLKELKGWIGGMAFLLCAQGESPLAVKVVWLLLAVAMFNSYKPSGDE